LWGNALAHRKSVADFGEYAPKYTGPKEKFGTWTDWYHDYLKLSNQETGEPHVPVGAFQTHADVPQLDRLLMREYPNFDMNIPDQYREVLFQHRFEGWVKGNNLPDLVLIHLPNDHTPGSAKNEPTPAAMNADNDLALGKMVDLISHSKYWKDSAMFVTEDDSQAGTDQRRRAPNQRLRRQPLRPIRSGRLPLLVADQHGAHDRADPRPAPHEPDGPGRLTHA